MKSNIYRLELIKHPKYYEVIVYRGWGNTFYPVAAQRFYRRATFASVKRVAGLLNRLERPVVMVWGPSLGVMADTGKKLFQ